MPFGQHRCGLSGTHRVMGGELTKRQLAQDFMRFATRKVEASCALNSSNAAPARPVFALSHWEPVDAGVASAPEPGVVEEWSC